MIRKDWPTPTEDDSRASGSRIGNPETKAHPGTSLTDATARTEWPSPKQQDATGGAWTGGQGGPNLKAAMAWPTPRSEDSESCGGDAQRHGTLTGATRRDWPTPGANDDKSLGNATPGHPPQLRHVPHLLAGPPAPAKHSTSGSSRGSLNSKWVAQLMGFPSDWCDLPTETLSALTATRSSRKLPK